MANNKVEIEVKASVTGQESVGALGGALDSAGQSARKMGAEAGGTASGIGQADTAAKGLASTTGKLGSGMDAAATQIANAKTELLALVGVGAGLQGVKDIASLADSYKNLEARIKLTTGEGKAFDTAFAGVFDVAKRTNSAVEETGLLFTKLAEAGKTLGISQSEALKLTETINQSIQLSGASAEASKASIIQLVQGLQSGVLRGDEFNSIMEQSPRLSKALADGLNVTTGELRKMAEAGQLSSATVIKALQGQSDAVQAEFGKLPATVGRAMTNLTTAFTAYVGESDKAGGYTSKLAGLIDGLAGNLSTVATVMIHTGQVMGAMKLLSMAQDWIAASAAIKATAGATDTVTTSTIRSTVAKGANTTATITNTTAQVANAAAWNDVATKMGGVGPKLVEAGGAATSTVGKFGVLGGAVGGLMRAFAPLLALDLVLNFKSYGTAIGEWAAQMMGAKDRSAELAAAEKRATEEAQANADARKKQAAATKEAADRSFGLTKEASALITKFDEMRTKGESAASAIASIGKDFDLSNVPGIKNAAAVLDKLAADGKLSASEVQQAWAKALDGKDLVVFETMARAAFKGTAREAQELAQVMDATLRESIKRTGLDMAVISGGMGKAAISAINDTQTIIAGLDKLKAQGVDTAQVLSASLGKSINTADSQKALDGVRQQIESVRKALGDTVANGLLDQAKKRADELKDALDKAKPGINSLREAMKDLGVVSDASLKATAESAKTAYEAMKADGKASTRELADGFKAYAEKAIAANGGVASGALKLEAAIRGVTIAVDASGKATVENADKSRKAIEEVTRAYIPWGEAAEKAAEREVQAREKVIATRKKELDLIQQEIDLENKRRGVDKDGFSTDKTGQKIVGGSTVKSATGIMNFLKEAGVDDEAEVKRITSKYLDPDGTVTYGNNRGQLEYGGDTVSMSLLHAAEQYTLHGGKERVAREKKEQADQREKEAVMRNGGQPLPTPTSPATPAPTAPVESIKTVNVRITLPDGSVKNVPTTQDGSYALISALQSAKLSAGY